MKALCQAGIAIVALLMVSLATRADNPLWPEPEKQAAIGGCKAAITAKVEQEYLKRSNLTELPPGWREMTQPSLQPILALCDCALGELEKEWTLEYLMAHQSEVLAKMATIMGSVCKIPATPKQDAAEVAR